jgi:pimeloyl-ACP methyl ester carboxylesterase
LTAQSLAQQRFATVRIRPGLRAPEPEMDVTRRLTEMRDAADVLAARGLPLTAMVGVGFGGTMGALAAQELATEGVALVEPVVLGNQFLEESLQRHAVVELMTAAEIAREHRARAEKPKTELAERGVTTVRGFRVTQAAADRMVAIDLIKDMDEYRGRALVVSISAAGTAPEAVEALVAQLRRGGAQARLETVQDNLPVPFGEYYFTGTPPSKIDSRYWLDRRVAELVAGWVADKRGEVPE